MMSCYHSFNPFLDILPLSSPKPKNVSNGLLNWMSVRRRRKIRVLKLEYLEKLLDG